MRSRPQIAMISEHASPLALLGGEDCGGQNVYVDEVSRHLSQLGYDIDIFVRRDDPDADEVVRWGDGVRVVHVDAGPPAWLLKDAMWPHMPAFRDAFVRFARRQPRRYDLIHSNFWMSGWVGIESSRRLGIPVVQSFHALGKTKREHQGAADTSPLERMDIERRVVDEANRIIAHCPSEVDELTRHYRADAGKLVVIPAGVDVKKFRPVDQQAARRKIGLPESAFVVTYVGRMVPRKGVRNVVRAIAKLRTCTTDPVRLLVVGGATSDPDPVATPEIGELQRLAAELGISDLLHFSGQRQPDELRYYYGAGDVAVTTPWYEPFGLTPLEAMACGRPVIGSAVGGITFTIEDGETGFTVPPRDPGALANRLAYLREHPHQRRSMGRTARKRVEQHFSWPRVAWRTALAYRTLLAAERVVQRPGSPSHEVTSNGGLFADLDWSSAPMLNELIVLNS